MAMYTRVRGGTPDNMLVIGDSPGLYFDQHRYDLMEVIILDDDDVYKVTWTRNAEGEKTGPVFTGPYTDQ